MTKISTLLAVCLLLGLVFPSDDKLELGRIYHFNAVPEENSIKHELMINETTKNLMKAYLIFDVYSETQEFPSFSIYTVLSHKKKHNRTEIHLILLTPEIIPLL